MHEAIAQLAELHPNCFRRPGQPLKIGIHNDIIARYPELEPGLIASALRMYTRHRRTISGPLQIRTVPAVLDPTLTFVGSATPARR
jgi:sRNA-binding protein